MELKGAGASGWKGALLKAKLLFGMILCGWLTCEMAGPVLCGGGASVDVATVLIVVAFVVAAEEVSLCLSLSPWHEGHKQNPDALYFC